MWWCVVSVVLFVAVALADTGSDDQSRSKRYKVCVYAWLYVCMSLVINSDTNCVEYLYVAVKWWFVIYWLEYSQN